MGIFINLYYLANTRLRKVNNIKLKDFGRAMLAADYSVFRILYQKRR